MDDYIDSSGFTQHSDKRGTYVVCANGEVLALGDGIGELGEDAVAGPLEAQLASIAILHAQDVVESVEVELDRLQPIGHRDRDDVDHSLENLVVRANRELELVRFDVVSRA